MFGSKSGFDTIEECFEDLSSHIFACETGLSSDPPMNWRVENLDRVRLISNSDAHSPGFLGRNASVFNTELSFDGVRRALEIYDTKAYQGTLDMHPHQGKYHYDGHRKCGVCLNPDDTAGVNGICPECGKPLTLGVLYRVRELANRPEGYDPGNRHPYKYIVPLADILSEIFEVGPKTKKVAGYYDKAIQALGPELNILTQIPLETIETAGVPLLSQAIEKMRSGDLYIDPGYDGEYGKVNIFTREEKEQILGENHLFKPPVAPKKARAAKASCNTVLRKKNAGAASVKKTSAKKGDPGVQDSRPLEPRHILDGLNSEQERAVKSASRAVVIQAGPGTGKTRTLTARIAWLISEEQVPADQVLALTFTNKAAKELSDRIESFIPQGGTQVTAATFHGFCLAMLKEYSGFDRGLMEDDLRLEILSAAAGETGDKKWPANQLKKIDAWISRCKQLFYEPLGKGMDEVEIPEGLDASVAELQNIYRSYDRMLTKRGLADFEDLIFMCYRMFSQDGELLARVRTRFKYIFVDEYQDLNLGQYQLVRLLAKKNYIFVIGDPDQSIYAFRGSDSRFFNQFEQDFPGCDQFRLHRNYRSTQTILDASFQVIATDGGKDREEGKIYSSLDGTRKIFINETASENAEAVAVGKVIEKGVGGLSFFSMDKGTGGGMEDSREYAFSDFAVLYRTRRQARIFADAFEKAGIPCQTADRVHWADMAGIKEILGLMRLCLSRGSEAERKAYEGFESDVAALSGAQNSLDLLETLAGWQDLETRCRMDEKLATAWTRLKALGDRYPVPGQLLDALRLDQDTDFLDKGAEKVSLLTMHAAKGLEFPVVFVTGCENGMIPFARDGKNVDDFDEERRLFYVAMTRAKDVLYLTYAKKRRIFGKEQQREKSCFINDIETELAQYEKGKNRAGKKRSKDIQLELF